MTSAIISIKLSSPAFGLWPPFLLWYAKIHLYLWLFSFVVSDYKTHKWTISAPHCCWRSLWQLNSFFVYSLVGALYRTVCLIRCPQGCWASSQQSRQTTLTLQSRRPPTLWDIVYGISQTSVNQSLCERTIRWKKVSSNRLELTQYMPPFSGGQALFVVLK